ncbi:MAG: APC family permease [Saprospiraceae bacterium]|nr:APC family permease [Saprospiraceae bacterium]
MKKLERSLSLIYVVAIAIAGMLGSGLFVLPGLAAAKTGPSIWLAYLLAGFCVLPAAISQAELATAMPTSGGAYVYIERAFGPILGTISGLGLWFSLLLKSSFALVGFGAYLLILADVPLKLTALLFLGLIMLLNIVGVRKVGTVQLVIISVSIASLVPLMLAGIVTLDYDLLSPAITHGNNGLITAVAFVFVSYAGITKVAAIAGEIKNPNRNLPLAMVLALLIVTAIYASITFVLVGNIPVSSLEDDIRPIYTLAHHLGGESIGLFAAVIGVLTLISGANSGVLAASRFPFAMSHDRLVPPFMAKVHQKYLTPITTIFLTCALMALVIIFLDVEGIAKLASAFLVAMFILVNACVVILRETAVQWYTPPYKSPLYPWLQLFGIVSGVVLLRYLGLLPNLAILLIVGVGIIVFLIYGRKQSQRSGVLKVYGHRPALYLLYQRQKSAQSAPFISDPRAGSLDAALDDAQVVVPLLGDERSPEMVVEMGAALAGGQKVQVLHLTEVPDITMLDALLEDDLVVSSLNRRIGAMAEEREVDVDFDAAVSHDLVKTIYSVSDHTHCQWMVMSWDGRARAGILVNNPVGWLVSHVNSHFALYKDQGVRYIRKILVGMRPGRDDAEFVGVADRIATFHGASLTFIRVCSLDIDKSSLQTLLETSNELVKGCNSPWEVRIVQSDDPLEALKDASAGFDLLITGTPRVDNWLRILIGSRDRFAELASCSVLRVTLHNHEKVEYKKVRAI